jgi:hypothetical protein
MQPGAISQNGCVQKRGIRNPAMVSSSQLGVWSLAQIEYPKWIDPYHVQQRLKVLKKGGIMRYNIVIKPIIIIIRFIT